jgi:adenine-specific DNA-methyltransferase
MAAINDLIARIQDPELRLRLEKEVKELTKHKKFGLVFENHAPEMTLLYDYPIRRGCKVIRKADDNKKLTEDILWDVKRVSQGVATCSHSATGEEQQVSCQDLICVAKNGEPIYPCLKYVDSVQNNPDCDLWHTLIEADNFHALQLLAYLYPQQVDCIYIDPPYNSGATDWKYNNNYVDGNDSYRHSKWLSMMESRLLLAKKLLNPKNSVLIVTIDEKEYLHLGCLLEEMFPEANIQMVTSVISGKGVSRDGKFSRVEEYIFFVSLGNMHVLQLDKNMLNVFQEENSKKNAVDFLGFRRRNKGNFRTSRPHQFYPVIVDNKDGHIVKIGDALTPEINRDDVIISKGCTALWPLDPNGSERIWSLVPESAEALLSKGYLKVINWNKETKTGSVKYLAEGMVKDIDNGIIVVDSRDEHGAVVSGHYLNSDDDTSRPRRVWVDKLHNASSYGTLLIKKFLGEKRFSFPKSLYAVHDAIRFFVANNPNALILDFFSGSGTTLHAVNLLNKEDGGHRRCIMVTNNEVSADEEKAFRAKGLHKGDEEWEKYGIARYVNWPRTKCSILGVDVNGKPIEGDYITSNTEEKVVRRSIKQISLDLRDDSLGTKLKKQIVGLIGDKKIPQNAVKAECPYLVPEGATNAILFNITKIDEFMEEINDDIDTIYVVTSSSKAFTAAKNELNELPERTQTVPVTIPMADGFAANAVYYKLTFLDKNKVSLGTQLEELLPILWMKAGAHGVCPTNVKSDYTVFVENKMAILGDEFTIDELKAELRDHPDVETVYIIDDSEENYRTLATSLHGRKTFQLYRDYLDNFKINIERKQ